MEPSVLDIPENTEENREQGEQTELKRKTHMRGQVIKTTLAGAIVDIGLDSPGVVHISRLKREPVNRVEDVVQVGQVVDVWVRRVDPETGRVDLTMIEPLSLEWREIKKGMVIKGKVTRVESFGAFIDIGAERPGLVHISELSNDYVKSTGEFVKENDEVEVKVIGVNRRKKRIRLSMKALMEKPARIETIEPDEEPQANEPVPTAMEMALREAMDRAKDTVSEPQKAPLQKKTGFTQEIDDIIARTLEQKAGSSSKP